MVCKKCGEKNSDNSKFCKKCGKSIGNTPHRYSNKKWISLIVLVLVGFLSVLGAIMIWQMGGISAGQEFSIIRHGEFSQLDEGFTDVTVRNYEDVIYVAEEALDILGIEDENRDLEMLSVYASEDIVFYKVQEYIGDYPVYGRNAVVLVNEEGTVLGFTSNITSYEDLNLEEVPDIDVGAILASVEQYCEMNDEALLVQYIVDDPQIYTYNDITTMVYFISLFNEESDISIKEACVDAYTNQVLFVNDLLYEAEAATCYNEDNSISVVGSYEEGTYSLYNLEREITIYSLHGTDSLSEDRESEVITSENNIFGDTQEEQELNQETAIQLMQNCTLIYDYYEDTYNECPSDEYLFCYDDGYEDGENALGGNLYLKETNSKIGFISVGSKMDINELDLLAHEYTHIVTRENVNWIQIDNYNEPGAINEAYSDIFGEVIEAYLTGEEPDWQHSTSRNIADPESDGYPVALSSRFTEYVALGSGLYSDFDHGYSTIISHCAYQMYTGVDDQYVKLSIEEIGDLFYYTMFTLPGNCDFQTLYDNLVFVAKLLDFSEDQIKCIEAAFNEAGINGGRLVYSDETVLSVLDGMRNPVVSYEVEISGQEETLFSTKDYYNTFKSDEDGYVNLAVPDGEYTLTIIIDDYKYVESLTINSKSGYKALTAQTYYIDEYTTIINTGETEIDYSQEIDDITFEVLHNSETYSDYAIIQGIDAEGAVIWEVTTDESIETELYGTYVIGQYENLYIYAAGSKVTALNILDGSIAWENSDFYGRAIDGAFTIGEEGTIYLCGYYGPEFFAVDINGNTLGIIETLDERYMWPKSIVIEGDKALVYMYSTVEEDYYDNSTLCVEVDLNTMSVIQEVVQEDASVLHLSEVPGGFTPIYTAEDLSNITSYGNYILMNDIDLQSYGYWEPIEFNGTSNVGVFDGNGYVIKNLNINLVKDDSELTDIYVGLFSSCNNVEIKNLGIASGTIKVNSYTGAYVGGIVGFMMSDCIISNCYNNANINVSTQSGSGYIGGISGAGWFSSSITDCYNRGNITGVGTYTGIQVGGIVGALGNSKIENVYNSGLLTGQGLISIGGLVGYDVGKNEISDSFYSASDMYTELGRIDSTSDSIITNVKRISNNEKSDVSVYTGFDFNNIWEIDEGKNEGFPCLKLFDY